MLTRVRAPQAAFFSGQTVALEEKVDGANLGLWRDAATGALVAQNRGHVVNGATHAQFRALPAWLARHAAALHALLTPGRVLFGEWLYARHSVAYARLPDYFLAFDVYDAARGGFVTRAARDALLAGSGLHTVPLVYLGPLAGARDLLARLQAAASPLTAGGGPPEGLYLRVDDEAAGRLVARAKIVRPDFLQALGAHWSGRALERNTLRAWDDGED